MEQVKRTESTIESSDYKWPFGIFKTIFLLFLIFTITFILSFPLRKIFNHFLALGFQSQPKCKIDYKDYKIGVFPPRLSFDDVTVPSGCLLRTQEKMDLNSMSVGFGGLSFSPLSAVVNLGLQVDKSPINIKVASNGKEHVLKIVNQSVDLEEFTQLVRKVNSSMIKLSGKAKLNLDASFKDNKLENLNALKIKSDNFSIPEQFIAVINLPFLDLKNLDVNILGKKDKLHVKTFDAGNKKSPLKVSLNGNILANFKNFPYSKLDLKALLRANEEVSNQLGLSFILAPYKTNNQGEYSVALSGTIQAPSYKKP